MASVVLDQVWLHLETDLAIYVTANLSSLSESANRPAEVRRYAGGRLRKVSRPGSEQALSVGLELADRATVDQLRAWVGETLMYRDPTGRLLYGFFNEIDVDEVPGGDLTFANASLVFRQISGSAEV